MHAGMAFRFFRADFLDHGMWMRRTKQLRVQHARHEQIVGVAQRPGHLGAPVDPASRTADDVELLLHAASLRSCSAAPSMASTIWL